MSKTTLLIQIPPRQRHLTRQDIRRQYTITHIYAIHLLLTLRFRLHTHRHNPTQVPADVGPFAHDVLHFFVLLAAGGEFLGGVGLVVGGWLDDFRRDAGVLQQGWLTRSMIKRFEPTSCRLLLYLIPIQLLPMHMTMQSSYLRHLLLIPILRIIVHLNDTQRRRMLQSIVCL